MKRWLLIMLAVCLLLPFTGLARDQLTWEQRASSKLTRTVATYVVEQGEDGTPLVREAGSLPAGTHVVFCDYDRETKLSKVVHNMTGSETEVWIRDREAVVSTIVRVNFDDGSYLDFPEALVNDRAALLRILRQMFPNRTINPVEGSSVLHMSEEGLATAAPTHAPVRDEQTKLDSTREEPANTHSKPSEPTAEETAFNIAAPWRLKQTVTSYADAHMKNPAGTIAIGTHAQITGDYNHIVQISYYQNGRYQKAHIYRTALMNNFTQYKTQAGETHNISPEDPNYQQVLTENQVTYLADTVQTGLDERISLQLKAAEQGVQLISLAEQPVVVEQLGLVTSQINAGEGLVAVPTKDLQLEGSDNAQLAAIYAPKTGKCSLWAEADSGSKFLKQCKAGVLVQVLGKDATFTKINYKGQEGYVRSDCLYFPEDGLTDVQGILAYEGRTTGSTTINLRNGPGKEYAKVAEWKTGTPITILSVKEGWLMVEAKGVLAFVMEEFVIKGK